MDTKRVTVRLVSWLRDRGQVSEEDLFEAGVLDSMGLLELIAFIEEEFEVSLDATQMNVNNFRTISQIVALVASCEEK